MEIYLFDQQGINRMPQLVGSTVTAPRRANTPRAVIDNAIVGDSPPAVEALVGESSMYGQLN